MPRTQCSLWAWNMIVACCCAACSAGDSGSTGGVGGLGASVVPPATTIGAATGAPAGAAAPHLNGSGGTAPIGTANPPVSSAGRSGSAGNGAGPTAGNGSATPAGTGGVTATVPKTPHDTKTCLQPGNGNYTEPGPYKVATKEVDLGMIEASQHTGKFTIYYPDPLETDCLHPIVAWGNGTGVQGAGVYAFLNNNAAAWGMVVAESEEDNTGSGNFHKAGLDYLLKQNADPSSMFYNKLSTRAGVSGHSQGGFGASAAASHPNVETVAIEGASNVATAKFSVLILTGTMDIVTNAEALVTNAKGPMFVADWEGGDHVTTETVAGYIGGNMGSLQFTRLYAAWFRCFLADDGVACKLFSGGAPDSCGICKDPGWHGLASSNL